MKVSIHIEYFELFDHWSWEITVNEKSVYGVENDHYNAVCAAEFSLEDLLCELENKED